VFWLIAGLPGLKVGSFCLSDMSVR